MTPSGTPEIFAVLDKRDKLPAEAFAEIGREDHRSGEEKTTLLAIGQAARRDRAWPIWPAWPRATRRPSAKLTRLRELFDVLGEMGVGEYCPFDMGVVRGLAYYTGVVFEGFGKGGLQRAICGGGRYGQLLEVLGGPPMSGIGFGTSDVVILDVLAN